MIGRGTRIVYSRRFGVVFARSAGERLQDISSRGQSCVAENQQEPPKSRASESAQQMLKNAAAARGGPTTVRFGPALVNLMPKLVELCHRRPQLQKCACGPSRAPPAFPDNRGPSSAEDAARTAIVRLANIPTSCTICRAKRPILGKGWLRDRGRWIPCLSLSRQPLDTRFCLHSSCDMWERRSSARTALFDLFTIVLLVCLAFHLVHLTC